jgi:flagellar basal body P-ring formation protein FlgA
MSTLSLSIFRRAPRVSRAGAALLAALLGMSTAMAEPIESQTQALGSVRSAAEALLRAELRDVSYGVHLAAAQLDPRLRLAHCPSALAASRGAGAELGAHVTVRVSCTAAGTPWSVYVPVSIESDVNVLVLRQSALRGARLSAAQVSTETRRVPGLAVGYVTDVAALARHTLSRSLPAGTALTADAMLADTIVRQGQEVTLVASSPGISVRAAGKVLEDGREGARVRVQNLASLKIVEGVVDASGVIEITP